MPQTVLESWHNFFSLVGGSAATLVGLMFVAASVGTGVFTEERQIGLRTLLSPTVVAFSVVLAACVVGVLPSPNWKIPAVLIGGIGLLGVVYSAWVWRRMVRHGLASKIDREDRIWYAFAPALSYLVLTVAGAAFAFDSALAAAILALGICMLLLAGVRNAWDMTTWVVLRRKDP
jgi:hypothetical protein